MVDTKTEEHPDFFTCGVCKRISKWSEGYVCEFCGDINGGD